MPLPKGSSRGHLPWLIALLFVSATLTPLRLEAQEWYDLYTDGQSALRSGQPARAADLLRQAIRRRPEPGRSVPTYGTNSEPRYYPYLRLAEAYILLSSWDDAIKTLETSSRFGIEPAADRATLEARARAGLKASEPAPTPAPAPAAASPPPVPAESTVKATETPKPPVTSRVDTVRVEAPPQRPPATVESPRRGSPILEITSDPPGAQIFVDDAPVGRTDPETGRLRLTTLPPGRHRIRFSADGRNDLVTEVVVGTEPVPLRGELQRQAPNVVPIPKPPAPPNETNESPVPWAFAGLVIAALAASSLWFIRGRRTAARRRDGKPVRRTPEPGAGASFETFPIAFGDYQLNRRIGKGGMAIVYEAERRGERFALKRPLGDYLDDPRFRERFIREADLGRALHHPNIIRIFDRGQVGDTPYFAMELIDGETLGARLDRDGPIDPITAASITARIAEALDYAHLKGVIHRDLKPGNIMLDRSGGVKVMDYGIARAQHREGVTVTGAFVGTPHYAAPEAVESIAEPRSDLYSLGVVFFEMLTGVLPFPGENPLVVLHSHAFNPPPAPSSIRPGVPAALDRIVLSLLAKLPADRPTAEALLNELVDFLESNR